MKNPDTGYEECLQTRKGLPGVKELEETYGDMPWDMYISQEQGETEDDMLRMLEDEDTIHDV